MKIFELLLLSGICLSVGTAFCPLLHNAVVPTRGNTACSIPLPSSSSSSSCTKSSSSALCAGGFGGDGTNKVKSTTAKQIKPKPKQQWDRYLDLKSEAKIAVGVRMKEDDSEEWLRVGNVRSKDSAYTSISIALQRALIAEHAKRLYPLQVNVKKTLEWGYLDSENDTWSVVDKSILDDITLPEGIDKMIGFEGQPDPATGFYCIYEGGKIKLGDETSFKAGEQSSKKK